MLDLPDGLRDDAAEAAVATFFDEWGPAGSYAICQDELVRHEATADEMSLNAEALGKLIPALQELFGLEKEHALRKAAVLRKYRRKRDDRRRTSILSSRPDRMPVMQWEWQSSETVLRRRSTG